MAQPAQTAKRVLIVDDDTALAELICEVLNTAGGIMAEHVGDGEAALVAWKAARPDQHGSTCSARRAVSPWRVLIALIIASIHGHGMYAMREVETVPTERLIANLEKRLNPKPVESDKIRVGELAMTEPTQGRQSLRVTPSREADRSCSIPSEVRGS